MAETRVSSFIVRFVQEPQAEGAPTPAEWRGVIRHVQSNEERHFTHIKEALAFMAQYVPLDGKKEIRE